MPPSPPAHAPHVLITDFDGTISQTDMGDLICDRFASPTWRELDQAWEAGEMSLFAAQERIWGTIRAAGTDVLAYAERQGRLRPGFDAFLDRAEQRGVPVILASGGFDFYIRAMLGARLERFAAVLSNTGSPLPVGIDLRFPHRDTYGCERCAVCKGRVCDRHRPEGGTVTFIGDGNSDRCAIGRADRIFAVRGSKLAGYCTEAGVPALEFTDFHELLAHL